MEDPSVLPHSHPYPLSSLPCFYTYITYDYGRTATNGYIDYTSRF